MSPVPFVAFGDLLPRLRLAQGEHVALCGPPGVGKTTLALELITGDRREDMIAFGVKGEDSTLQSLMTNHGYHLMREWRSDEAHEHRRVVLWPELRGLGKGDRERRAAVFADCLDAVSRVGGYTLYLDEVVYCATTLRLSGALRDAWQLLRASHVSIIAGAQRPYRAPVEFTESASHLFVFKTGGDLSLKRLIPLMGEDPGIARQAIRSLGRHEFLYVDCRREDSQLVRSRMD